MSDITLSTRVKRASRTAARTISGRSVVVIIDAQRMHTLNEVGTHIFEQADGRTLDELVETVIASFSVERADAESDVLAFVHELESLGALEVVP